MTTPGVRLHRATSSDTDLLTENQTRTFSEDAQHSGGGLPGPTGYDSPAWNRGMIANSYYYKIMLGGAVIGGLIVLRLAWSHFHLARIWVDRAHQDHGAGSRALALVEARFPQATRWTVEVPAWAHRRRHFYKLNGYQASREVHGTVEYEKPRKGILRLRSLP